jgi:hypothetical protein
VTECHAHLFGLEVCALGWWLDLLEAWLLKHEQCVAVCALAWLRGHPGHCEVALGGGGGRGAGDGGGGLER